MLPTQPQSLFSLLLNSIKATKKIFWLMLPIVAVDVVVKAMCNVGLTYGNSFISAQVFLFVTPVLVVFFICWSMYFAYEVLSGKKASYLNSFLTALKRFWRAFLMLFVIAMVFLALVFIVSFIMGFFPMNNRVFYYGGLVVLVALAAASFFYTFGFYLIYTLEILVNRAKFFQAAVRAFKINRIFRVAGMFVLLFLVGITPGLILYGLFSLVPLLSVKLVLAYTVMLGILGLVLGLLYTALYAVCCVYLYNDLVVRHKD